jgi:hypothetical protein
MPGWSIRTIGAALAASALCATALAAQAKVDVCALATNAEWQQAHGVDPRIGIIPDDPVPTQMVWGPHCDYAVGSIDLFTEKSPSAELERVLGLMNAQKERDAVPGLGNRAFFTVIYPDDQHRRRGFLAVFVGSRIVSLSMDPKGDEPPAATRPKLESLAKLVLPRLK